MNRLFIIFWSVVVIIASGLMVMIYVSLIPHFIQIGIVASIVLYAWMGFGTVAGWAFISLKIYRAFVYRNVISVGEVVAYRNGNGGFDHLSAAHEQAKVPRLLPAPSGEPPFEPDAQSIIDIYNANKTITLKDLAERFDMKYNQVQKIYADAKSRGLITRK
jgi:hypothetical protein